MKPRYRIFTVGGVPIDLKERIAAIQAEAILKARSEGIPVRTSGSNSQNEKAVISLNGQVREATQVSAGKTDEAPSGVTGKVREFA